MIPASKTNDLIDQMRPLLSERRPSELAVRKIRLDAEKLVRSGVDPAQGHMILGSLDSLEFNVEGVKNHFKIAQQLSPDRVIPFNYCVVGRRIGLMGEIRKTADSLLSRYPDDLKVLNLVNEMAGVCCDLEMMFDARERSSRLGQDLNLGAIQQSKFIPVASRAKKLGISTEEIVARLDVAGATLRDSREPCFGAIYEVSPEGTVAYSFGLEASSAELTEYSLAIVDALVDAFSDPLSDLITISCLKKRELPTRELSRAGEETRA